MVSHSCLLASLLCQKRRLARIFHRFPAESSTKRQHDMSAFKRKYKFGSELGRGGFGRVYGGFRVSDGLPIAVKFVARHNVTDWGEVREGF